MKSHIIRNIEESKGEHDSLILNIDLLPMTRPQISGSGPFSGSSTATRGGRRNG
ncbi:hypothetical protein [Methanogenium cariaci]|uniref:hypothetical protein n=1 Tax=Methanogenium cariaci TaxID=2197 RepID=UPI0012F6B028|nr:hypothetical protein [Methanogenium cariaci]